MIKYIVLKDMFEGTQEQFETCFFANSYEGSIRAFAKRMKVECTITFETDTKVVKYESVLAYKVNRYLDEGYELYGLPMIIWDSELKGHLVYQTLVLKEKCYV